MVFMPQAIDPPIYDNNNDWKEENMTMQRQKEKTKKTFYDMIPIGWLLTASIRYVPPLMWGSASFGGTETRKRGWDCKSHKSITANQTFFTVTGLRTKVSPLPDRWINKMQYIRALECDSATKRNKLLIWATTWMKPENMQRERR